MKYVHELSERAIGPATEMIDSCPSYSSRRTKVISAWTSGEKRKARVLTMLLVAWPYGTRRVVGRIVCKPHMAEGMRTEPLHPSRCSISIPLQARDRSMHFVLPDIGTLLDQR